LTSFQHLSNLERLDISNNQLESVRHLACLRHLRVDIGQVVVLEADPHKRIEICQPIQIRDPIVVRFALRTLLAASNRLTDLTSFQHLSNLERLDISNNQLYARQVSNLVVVPVG
jgi:hypothetical protein